MYAKLNNGVIEKYPYTIGDLRKDNPNTSFPANIPQSLLAEYGMVHVVVTGSPKIDYTKNCIQQTPVFNNQLNRWEMSWLVTDATAEEIADRIAKEASRVRDTRNKLLSDCDWTQVADAPVDKTVWATYRQELRNVPDQPGFPWEVVWPTKPE